jgi:hypothetical protein
VLVADHQKRLCHGEEPVHFPLRLVVTQWQQRRPEFPDRQRHRDVLDARWQREAYQRVLLDPE